MPNKTLSPKNKRNHLVNAGTSLVEFARINSEIELRGSTGPSGEIGTTLLPWWSDKMWDLWYHKRTKLKEYVEKASQETTGHAKKRKT